MGTAWPKRPACPALIASWRASAALLGVRVGRGALVAGGAGVGAATVGGVCCCGAASVGRGVLVGGGPGGRNSPVLVRPTPIMSSNARKPNPSRIGINTLLRFRSTVVVTNGGRG